MFSITAVAASGRASSKSRRARQVISFACESLEIRRLLTSQLYLDFGDNFPGGGLQMTVQTLRSGFGSGGLQGPDLRQGDTASTTTVDETIADTTNITFAPTSPLVTFDYDQSAAVDNADYTSLRANVLALVQRYYAPFDVNVQIAPALDKSSSANYVTAVSNLLQQGANTNGEYDGYVFIANVTRDSDGGSVGGLTSNFGISNGADIGNSNANDNSEIAFADQILGAVLPSGLDADTRLGYTAAHEPGHDFGLQHTNNGFGSDGSSASGNVQTDNDMILQTSSNIVTGSANNTPRQNLDFFTRFPLVVGDGNSVVGGGFSAGTTTNPYNILSNGNNLGLKGGFAAYITGTGAFDRITLANGGGTTVNVTMQSFREAAFTNQIGGTQNYSVDSSNGILIETGFSADQVTINANINASVTLHGMNGNDSLIVLGNNAASGSFTPGAASSVGLDDNTYFGGTLVAGGTTINVAEYVSAATIRVQDITTFTYRTPNPADSVTIDTPSAGQNRATGSSGGVAMLPVSFSNVTNFIVDTATNDGAGAADTVIVQTSGPATGMQTFAINTGGGDDDVRILFGSGNPIPSGGLSFDGGSGTGDLLSLSGGSFNSETYVATGAGSGNINLDGSVINYTNLAPINDTVTVASMVFNATAGGETINFLNGPSLGGTQSDQINSGSGTFERLNFANKTAVTINGQGGADTFNHSATAKAAGLSSLLVNGGSSGDSFNFSTTLAGIPTTANGAGGGDVFNITGAGVKGALAANGQDGDDTFNVTSSADAVITVDGGAHITGDLLSVDGESLDYTISASAFTTAGRQSIDYFNVEQLNVSHGTFGVPGTISARVSVDQDGKLYGEGVVLGSVSATLNGIISPGAATGSATGIFSTGSVNFAPTSSYQIQVNGLLNGTEHDVLNVSGTVSLGGANLDAAVNLTLVPGDEVMILHNDGVDPIIGKFAQGDMITIGAQKFAIDYAYDGDGDGNLNDVAIIRYGAALAPDPCEPGVMALFVSATTGADNIRLVPDNGNPRIHVFINTDDLGVFDTHGLILAFGQSGNDTITNSMPAHKSWLYGQGGNDTVTSGNQDSILLGGIGNDLLSGGNGKDIFIGGKGSDVLQGGNGDDILVASASAYETNNAANRKALCGIQDEWTHAPGGYADRINHLTNGGGANGTAVFNSTTLFEDNSVDSLFGQNGKDWFVMNSSGGGVLDLSDASKNDVISDV